MTRYVIKSHPVYGLPYKDHHRERPIWVWQVSLLPPRLRRVKVGTSYRQLWSRWHWRAKRLLRKEQRRVTVLLPLVIDEVDS